MFTNTLLKKIIFEIIEVPTSLMNSKYEKLISVSQNFPNPFKTKTCINYFINADSFVALKIYNLLGEEVSVLVNENQIAGHHKVCYVNNSLPEGIYLYKFNTGNYSITKKMNLKR